MMTQNTFPETITDADWTRPSFGILYRRYQDTRGSFVRIQADSLRLAMQELTRHVGSDQYSVTSANLCD